MNYETTCLMTRRIQPAVNFPRGTEVLNPLSLSSLVWHHGASIVIPRTTLIPTPSLVVSPSFTCPARSFRVPCPPPSGGYRDTFFSY